MNQNYFKINQTQRINNFEEEIKFKSENNMLYKK